MFMFMSIIAIAVQYARNRFNAESLSDVLLKVEESGEIISVIIIPLPH